VLRYFATGPVLDALRELAVSEPDQNVRLAALEIVAGSNDPAVGQGLVAEFSAQTPTVRRAILNALLQTEAQTKVLLDEIDAERIRASEIDPVRWGQLSKHKNVELAKLAKRLFEASQPADRQKVLADYQKALTTTADPKRGREVFVKNCASCHRIGEVGVNVAPDIADSRTQQPSQLLTSIVDPNRAVDNNYFSYTVIMNDGKIHTGIIGSETSSSLTLRQQENKTIELLRRDIEEVRSNGVSLMPVGLEKNITVEQMADLISFVKNWRYLDGAVPASVIK
jgi:putative heme-binding domain-containing protein